MHNKAGMKKVKMNQDRVKVTQIQQVCIICNDLQKTMEAYWNILGIGPWAVTEFGQPKCPDMKYYGKPAWGRCRQAVVQLGPIELELLEPIEGVSIYHDWLAEHGEGLHHIKFLVEDLDINRVEKEMRRLGLPSIQDGHFGPDLIYQFAYFDTMTPLKAIWVTSNRTGGTPQGSTFFPANPSSVSPAKVKVGGIKQIGFCVKDAISTAENYWNILGIGPWQIRYLRSDNLYDCFYYGKPAWARWIVAHAYMGDLELELVQPVEGDSIHRDWIQDHGEGMHHLKFLCDDLDEVVNLLNAQGFQSIQSIHFGDPKEQASAASYIEIPPLRCIWEPVYSPKGLPVKPIATIPAE